MTNRKYKPCKRCNEKIINRAKNAIFCLKCAKIIRKNYKTRRIEIINLLKKKYKCNTIEEVYNKLTK